MVINPINQVSSYLSMRPKFKQQSLINYYTILGNDSKHSNSSIANSYLTNYPMINSKYGKLS